MVFLFNQAVFDPNLYRIGFDLRGGCRGKLDEIVFTTRERKDKR